MPKVGVLLSGCGFKDGSEIHEAVLTLLYLDQRGAKAVFMAPNIDQLQVVNHLTGQPAAEHRCAGVGVKRTGFFTNSRLWSK